MYRPAVPKNEWLAGTANFSVKVCATLGEKAAIEMAAQKSDIDIVERFEGIGQAYTLQSKKRRCR